MVFESVVADLLNRFLGSYVDNLNASQLNIGIWGGDVKLNNLEIKETALDELDLPIKLKFGYAQSLVLKIPWKNLYTEPTIVDVSGLYLIIVPNQGIVYNEQKANKNEQEAKQKRLARLEENRRNRQKPKEIDDTFTEKLVAQVIKNLQVRIKRVHVRYEDKFSNRDRPFAAGATLESLDFQTTDEKFNLIVQREAVKIFYKLVSMNNLSMYSNAKSDLISDMRDKNAIIDALRQTIATHQKHPEGYKYVLEPLSINARLKLNQKPEADGSDWTIPKIDLSMELDKLALAIGQFQYQDMLLFLEAQERFTLSEKYLKYRPHLTQYREHYKEWWHFAYKCILHEQVKRHRQNWSWLHMKSHRKLVREYYNAWIYYRTEKSPSEAVKKKIKEAEQQLDVFNLNIARQQAEFEIDRQENLIRVEDQQEQGWVQWTASWFGVGGGAAKKQSEDDKKIIEKLEKEVTPEEKERLFEAIDYQENMPPTDYPKHYVENRFLLALNAVTLALEDVMELRFTHLSAKLEQRPSANALRFRSAIKSLEMCTGKESMLHMTKPGTDWLAMEVETNPLKGGYDHMISLNIAPVMLKYHAPAVNRALDVFKPPKSVRLHQLTALAIARYEDVKARSATALQHMVDVRKTLKLDINIEPTCIVVCAGGVYDTSKPALVADLGELRMKTLDEPSPRTYKHIDDPRLRSLVMKAYDNYQLCLSNLQLIYADTLDIGLKARGDRLSRNHLLKPTGMLLDVLRSSIDDIQLPTIRVFGELPDVVLTISDDRLVKLLELFNSIPRPVYEEEVVDLAAPVVLDGTNLRDRAKMKMIMEVDELSEDALQNVEPSKEEKEPKEQEERKLDTREQMIQFELNLQLNEVGVIVNHRGKAFLSAHVRRLGMQLRKRMFDMKIRAALGSLTVEMPQIEHPCSREKASSEVCTLYLIDNEMGEDGNDLINMIYMQATDESPTFKTEFGSNEQSVQFTFQILNFNLHKEALNELMSFNNRLQRKLARIPPPAVAPTSSDTDTGASTTKKRTPSQSSRQSSDSRQSSQHKMASQRRKTRQPIQQMAKKLKKFVFEFRMHEIAAKLFARQSDIAGGIAAGSNSNEVSEFCAINIQNLNLNGRLIEDGSMRIDMGLAAFTMDDRRKNTKLARLMDKKDAKSTEQLITMKYNQSPAGDKFVDLLSSKFFLMLAPEFLGVLSTFFIFHPSDDEEDDVQDEPVDPFATDALARSTSSRKMGTIASPAMMKTVTSQQQIVTPQQTAEAGGGALTLNCRIYEIEVILIEDSLKPQDSQAMILSFNAMLDAKNIDGVQRMNGGIQHLQVYSTYFAKEKRSLLNYPILKKLDIQLTGAIDEKRRTQKYAVKMDQVEIRMSPAVIRLLTAVSTQFSEHQKKDQEQTAKAVLREYKDYWAPKKLERNKFWWFTEAGTTKESEDPNVSNIPVEDAQEVNELPKAEQADFTLNRLAITMEAGSKNMTRPMIMMESSLVGQARNWSSTLVGSAETKLKISYYNEEHAVWEPVIEPVLHEHEGWQSWKLSLKIGPRDNEADQISLSEPSTSRSSTKRRNSKKKRGEDGEEQRKQLPPAKITMLVEATETLDITITKSFLQLLNQLFDESIPKHKRKSVESPQSLRHIEFHFVNTLPLPLSITSPIQHELEGGDGVDIVSLDRSKMLEFSVKTSDDEYVLSYRVPDEKKVLETIHMKSRRNPSEELCLGLNWSTDFSPTTLSIYAPYWMVNETGRQLRYLPTFEVFHPPATNPIILQLREEDFQNKKKTKVKIEDVTDWSAELPLDIAGSSGRITCKSETEQREYEMTVDVQLSQSGLTKVVTISPFYLLQNASKFAIEVCELNCTTANWITVPPESVIGFWPVQKSKRKILVARFPNTVEPSVPFPFTEAFEGFCKIDNSLIGVYVVVSLSDDSSVIYLEHFVPGMAPALLMNATKYPVEFKQDNEQQWSSLPSNKLVPFAWNDTLEKHKFEWKSGDAANSDELLRNRDSSYLPSKTDQYHYCVSFLNGRQRIFLFTDDEDVSFIAFEAYEMEQPNLQLELRLQGIGISIVNNLKSVELVYMAICPLNRKKESEQQQEKEIGFWCQLRQTDHQTTLHVKLFNFQVDNQLPSSIFPSMLAMVPQPKSVVKNEPKPFLETSLVKSQSEHTNIVQIKLLQTLVQEFAIRLDGSLINELLDMFPKESIQTVYNRESFAKDMALTRDKLTSRALQTRVTQTKDFYEYMHISPLMMHLSFSQGHTEEKKKEGDAALTGIQYEFINLLLKSVGVTITEIQDVVFKLAFFQREATFYNRTQLQSEIQSHYVSQFIRQAYVLVLGLDIIGNPFGLVRDLRTGATDLFYQPVMGLVTGPSEFVEGLKLGVTSAFSHTVGGVLGVASRITGTMGKGVAALTLDEDYQRRRIMARQQPASVGEGMVRGMRGVTQGVLDGVTGVASKPMEGIKKGGILGGVKGLGKGMIGVVTRPVSGVVDMVTTTADTVKTLVTNAESVQPIRPPRVIANDKIIRPFVFEEAIGYKIFKATNRGEFAESEHYLTYGSISKHLVIIVTDTRVIESRQHELTGNWNAAWNPTYAEIRKPKRISPEGIEIKLKETKKSFFSFGSSTRGKRIVFNTEHVAQRVLDQMTSAWEKHPDNEA